MIAWCKDWPIVNILIIQHSHIMLFYIFFTALLANNSIMKTQHKLYHFLCVFCLSPLYLGHIWCKWHSASAQSVEQMSHSQKVLDSITANTLECSQPKFKAQFTLLYTLAVYVCVAYNMLTFHEHTHSKWLKNVSKPFYLITIGSNNFNQALAVAVDHTCTSFRRNFSTFFWAGPLQRSYFLWRSYVTFFMSFHSISVGLSMRSGL